MPRRTSSLLPLEADILAAGIAMRRGGEAEFHGFEIAKQLRDADDARRLTGHGTLYKALGRLHNAGLLESRWEDPNIAAEEGRPRRRLYQVTGAGERALAVWVLEQRTSAPGRAGLEPT